MWQLPQGIAQTPVITEVFKDQFSVAKISLYLVLRRRLVFKGWKSLCLRCSCVEANTQSLSPVPRAIGSSYFSSCTAGRPECIMVWPLCSCTTTIFGLAELKGSSGANKNADRHWITKFLLYPYYLFLANTSQSVKIFLFSLNPTFFFIFFLDSLTFSSQYISCWDMGIL